MSTSITTESSSRPMVQIGLPVRNGGSLLDESLRSLTSQTYENFSLLISDNASDDDTPAVCEAWMRRDPRIQYFRQPQNIGPTANFLYVLQRATTPLFMWAAHDDWWHPEFLAENVAALEAHDDVVCSVPIVELVDVHGVPIPNELGTRPLMGDRHENLMTYLDDPGANSRIYGVYRTNVLQRCFRENDTYWAFDWTIVARTLVHGKHYHVPRPLMRRSARGMSSDAAKCIPRFNPTWLGRRFPMLPFTRHMLTDPDIPFSFGLVRVLGRWNRRYFQDSMRKFRRRYVRPVLERVGLRPRLTPTLP